MSEALITQCPSCGTTFKLSRAQLDAANGSVRCGACLEVFAGEAYLVITPENHELLSIDQMPETGNSEGATPENTAFEKTAFENPAQESLAAGDPANEYSFSANMPFEQSATDEEENADIAEEHLVAVTNDNDFATDWYQGADIVYPFMHESESHQQPDWDQQEADSTANEQAHLGHNLPEPDRSEYSLSEQASTEFEGNEFIVDGTEFIQQLDDESLQSLDETIEATSFSLVEEPLDKGRFVYLVATGFLNLILLASLAAQFLWYNRNQLAEQEEYRGHYTQICSSLKPLINCDLPDYINLDQISTRKLIVRSHPKLKDVLVIDAIILNSASFAQPFPKLELKFTDLEFNTIASRRFKTSEYLGGELTGMKFIPAYTEVRLELEIVDPGEQAVSYELYAVHP